MKDTLKHILHELELVDEESIAAVTDATKENDVHNLNERLTSDEHELVIAIVEKFDHLIKGGFALFFIGLRQQIKAVQKEQADTKRKLDKAIRKINDIDEKIDAINSKLGVKKKKPEPIS